MPSLFAISKLIPISDISILVCAVILTVSLGTLVGYSIAKEDTGNKDTGNELAQQGRKDTQTKQMPANMDIPFFFPFRTKIFLNRFFIIFVPP